MSWWRRVFHFGKREPDPNLERADRLAEAIERGDIEVQIKVRNPRAIAEIRRLDAHARR